MKTNVRKFTRNFAAYRKSAARGVGIEIVDRDGKNYVFRLKANEPANFHAAVAHLAGVSATGVKKKTLTGYGRGR